MIKKLLHKQYLFPIILCFTSVILSAQSKGPAFILQDETILANLKKQYQAGNPALLKEVYTLTLSADKALNDGPYSVTLQKSKVAPSDDVHDYVSQAPYWWADPSKPDGKPYIRRDGERNPEIYQIHDDSQMVKLCETVKLLGFAYYFTGKEAYAQKAVTLLNTWFIDPATRMNANLNYGQYIPGVNDGRGIGIIESRNFVLIPDALAMLQGSKSINDNFISGIKSWFAEYAEWLQTSKNGTSEQKELNNHGTNYDMQLVDFLIFTGNTKEAHRIVEKQTIPRMDKQFTAEGLQPLELSRTKAWSYCSFNLEAWTRLCLMAGKLGIDLWHYETPDGKSIKKSIIWMLPFMLKQKEWTYKQIEPASNNELFVISHLALNKYADIDFKKVFTIYPQHELWMFN